MRDSFIMYASQYDAIEFLTDAEVGQVFRKIFLYCTRDEEYTCESKLADGIAKSFLPAIDAATNRHNSYVERGKKGGAPKGNQNAKKQPKTTCTCFEKQPMLDYKNNHNDNDNVNDDDNVNVNEKVNANVNEVLPESTSIKKKEEYDVDVNTGNRVLNDDEFEKWCYGCVDKFKSGIRIGIEPSVQQILGFMLDNSVGYYKSFFESYSTNDEGKLQIPLDDINEHLYQLIQPMASTYGYSISDNSEVLSKFNRWYVKSRLNDRKIDLI